MLPHPSFAVDDATDHRLVNSVFLCKSHLRPLLCGVQLSYFYDFGILKNSAVAFFPSSILAKSTFANAILSVVFASPQKQVIWIAAGWIIALMENAQACWYCSVMQFPSNAVRQSRFLAGRIREFCKAIPIFVSTVRPKPTLRRDTDIEFGNEPYWKHGINMPFIKGGV